MRDVLDISAAAQSVWAKSRDEQGRSLPLHQHLTDTAEVMRHLFEHWVTPAAVRAAADSSGLSRDLFTRVARFLAGVHDIGKATPAFGCQDVYLYDQMNARQLVGLPKQQLGSARSRAHHSITGQVVLRDWLIQQRGMARADAATWAVVVGGHHGMPPTGPALVEMTPIAYPDLYGEGRWQAVRHELLTARWEACQLEPADGTALSQPAQVLLMGLVIVADWIASNERLFPYDRLDDGRSARAMRQLRLPAPWRAAGTPRGVDDLFAARFALPPGACPRPSQRAALDLAWSMGGPGMVVIEAPMGEGKTEAALAVAEIMAHQFDSGGIFVALPTQATTDAMFGRLVQWLDRLPERDLQVGASLTLAHGKAALNRLYCGMAPGGRPRDIDADETAARKPSSARAQTHAWLTGRKKGALATVVVGTIDQVLFAALKSRHLALRMTGLQGKVVVIDEVHAYDTWMSSYLDRVLSWLGASAVPVVLLSATLPPGRRDELLRAYTRNRRLPGLEVSAYPVLTAATGDGKVTTQAVEPSGRGTSVAVELIVDELDTLVDTVNALIVHGGCILVLRNTVARAREAAAVLRCALGDHTVTLVHSRFLAYDRARNDEWLLDHFGSPARLADVGAQRPERHVVVATQVAEQSLDIDFDALITDVAPVDLVLQRVGRMHRHQRPRPSRLTRPACYLTGVTLTQAAPDFPTGCVAVYQRYPLLAATAVLLRRRGQHLELPGDIPALVQEAYAGGIECPESWQATVQEARLQAENRRRDRQQRSRNFQIQAPGVGPITDWAEGTAGDAEETRAGRAAVRDGPEELECVVVCVDDTGVWRTPEWLDSDDGGLEVPRELVPSPRVADAVARCSLRLGPRLSNAEVEELLWAGTPAQWENAPELYRWPVLPLGAAGQEWTADLETESRTYSLRYSRLEGLEVLRGD